MDLLEFIKQFDLDQILTFFLVLGGVILLISSIFKTLKFYNILKSNKFHSKKWVIVIVLIFFFVVGYLVHALNVFDFFELPINPILLVSLIYFFGAIFVFIAMRSTYSMVRTILGDIISNEKAIEIFLKRTEFKTEELPHLYDKFTITCKSCNCNISYDVADVVRQHSNLADKGVIVESTFGVKSIILRPTHKCKDGLREIIAIHDNSLAFRSVDQSRIILNTNL